MTELQGTVESVEVAPVTATGKKVLNESTKLVKESAKPSLKSIFNTMLSEADQKERLDEVIFFSPAGLINSGMSAETALLSAFVVYAAGAAYMAFSPSFKYYRQDLINRFNDFRDSGKLDKGAIAELEKKAESIINSLPSSKKRMLNQLVKQLSSVKDDKSQLLKTIRRIESYIEKNKTELDEADQVTIQPAKQNTQVIKQGQKTLGTVENPQLAAQIKQSIGKGEMTLAGDELEENEATPPVNNSKLADLTKIDTKTLYKLHAVMKHRGTLNDKSAPGAQVSAKRAADELLKRGVRVDEAKLTEKAVSKSQQQAAGAALAAKRGDAPKSKLKGASKEMAKMPAKELEKFAKTKHKGLPEKKKMNEAAGISDELAAKKIANKIMGTPDLDMLKIKQYVTRYLGMVGKAQTDVPYLAALVSAELENKNMNEAALPTNDSDFGAGLGAGRNSNTLEAKKAKPDYIDLDKDGNKKESMKKAAADKQKVSTMKKTNEAKAKPDFLDLDKDGDKKESMKKAQADKKIGSTDKKSSAGLTAAQKKLPAGLQKAVTKKKTVKEGTNPTESARLLGKSHAMANDTFSCKYEEGSQEAQAYLDGYKSGLDECYGSGGGMGMQQDIGMMSGMNSMVSMNDTPSLRSGSDFEVDSMDDMGGFGGFDSQPDEADMIAFESWDRELTALLNEGKMKDIDIDMKEMTDAEFKKEYGKSKADMKKELSGDTKKPVKEGMTVSISKGQQGTPDSVTVSAQDGEADQLLSLIKQAGLGLFGGDEPSGYGSPMQSQARTGNTDVVGDHDGMMALIKKMSDVGSDSSGDYEDEESHDDEQVYGHPDAACDVCGSSSCGCDDKEEVVMVDEEETEDQMEFQVAEDSAGQDEEEMTTADEDAEAKEDQALATADANSDDEEEIDESLYEWANDAGKNGTETTFEQDIDFMTKVISGGLNGPKKDQTTLPYTKVKVEEVSLLNDWKKLSGIK